MQTTLGPAKETYRNVEIRYGYDIVSDKMYAHFTLPEVTAEPHFQGHVTRYQSPTTSAGPDRVIAHSEESVLRRAKARIDEHLGPL